MSSHEHDRLPDASYVVETRGLTKRFGGRTAVDAVELRIPRGVAFGYLGPNGAGKTTLIRMLLGLTPVTAGSMRLLDLPVPERRAEALPVSARSSRSRASTATSPADRTSRSSRRPAAATRIG